jgi:hypothetical protein
MGFSLVETRSARQEGDAAATEEHVRESALWAEAISTHRLVNALKQVSKDAADVKPSSY